MIEFPLLRVDKKEYLESLLAGEFYMRNSLHYQTIEDKDAARNDPFDGSLPTDEVIDFPNILGDGTTITRGRLMAGNSFIKCFYSCNTKEVTVIDDHKYLIKIPNVNKKALMDFRSDSVMLVSSPNKLIERISTECQSCGYKLFCGAVCYLNKQQMEEQTIKFIENFINRKKSTHPAFYKDISYAPQKEFRFCIDKDFSFDEKHISKEGVPYFTMDKSLANETTILNIGDISDIACILSFDDLINHPLIVDMKRETIFISEEVY